ncbi:nicotinamide riboside transporter PnuC [Neisseria chenwenguii]|uniref:Nicotinamide riboside transporter PnuC n=1 Tax=Neisseria chenwenguii TaxID=1853278 RepID=A0A220S5M3_9NEIS|nr:nicotinamide riboside transporter PnuC [Neisseria chenwenguii]ASK28525.1 hypothetical protein BG910_08685 [Neisseria chenwenguii]ROV56653.1 nicotinamide riboside transporter PnuC [Neisseria chenwenguii]
MWQTLTAYITANPLEVFGVLLGFVYLWLEWRASIWLWVVGVVMPAVYAVVFYRSGLYADSSMQLYYIAAAVYGIRLWKTGRSGSTRPISRCPRRVYLPLAAATALLWLLLGGLLMQTDSNVVWADAFTTALSMTATWVLAQKYAEHWLAWIVVNAVSTVLYVYKGLDFTAFLYAFYTAASFFGYFKWLKIMKAQA